MSEAARHRPRPSTFQRVNDMSSHDLSCGRMPDSLPAGFGFGRRSGNLIVQRNRRSCMKPWRNPKAAGTSSCCSSWHSRPRAVAALGLRQCSRVPEQMPTMISSSTRAARGGPLDDGSEQAARGLASVSAEACGIGAGGTAQTLSCGGSTVSKEYLDSHQKSLAELKHLTRCLIARGKVAHLEGRTDEAFQSYAEAYQFALRSAEVSGHGLSDSSLLQDARPRAVQADHPSLSGPQMPEISQYDRPDRRRKRKDPGSSLGDWRSGSRRLLERPCDWRSGLPK